MSTVEERPRVPGTAPSPRLGFQSMEEETHVERLPTEGRIPEWLEGTLVRATPALMEIGGRTIRHWFDGLAMLNAFSFQAGTVGYGSRFLQTKSYREARKGREGFIGFANDPCRALFKRVSALFDPNVNDNCNVNVVRLRDRYLALTEMPLPVEFDPDTLETKGLVRFDDRLRGNMYSAHPHYDHARDELVSYVANVSTRNSYRFFALPAGATKRRPIADVKTRDLAYVHSFAITERFIVFVEFPLLVNPLRLFTERPRPFVDHFHWDPARGTRFYVIDRQAGRLHSVSETRGFFAFHHVNAFEAGDEIVVDVVVHEDGPSAVFDNEVLRLRAGGAFWHSQPRLHRYRLPAGGGEVAGERVADVRIEMPRINYRGHNTRPYTYAYGVAFGYEASEWWDQLVRLDVTSGEGAVWEEEGCYPGEPVFVPSPEARSEADGVTLSVVLDSRSERSFLLVLDAESFEELGRATAPHYIPFGFHGDYFPG